MDSQTALRTLLINLASGSRNDAITLAEVLADRLRRGHAMPELQTAIAAVSSRKPGAL